MLKFLSHLCQLFRLEFEMILEFLLTQCQQIVQNKVCILHNELSLKGKE
jgi:hypothetical protein